MRAPIAQSMTRPAADGSGIKTTLLPRPHARRTPLIMFFAKIDDGRAGGLEDLQAQQSIDDTGLKEPGP
jgi:hypothetical protein